MVPRGGIGGVFALSVCVSFLETPTPACKNWQARVVDAWLLGVFFAQRLASRDAARFAEGQSPTGNDRWVTKNRCLFLAKFGDQVLPVQIRARMAQG